MPKFTVDFVAQCSIQVEAKDEKEAREKAEEAADLTKNEKMMKAQLWENLQIESVTRD